MDTKIHITLGFKIDDIYFGWHENKLYQLPYMKSGRYFGLRCLRLKNTKNGWKYYHIRRKKVGIEKLMAMAQSVKWEINKPQEIIKSF
jgi:hypothetical protein